MDVKAPGRRYSKLQHDYYMNSRGESYSYTVNSNTVNNNMACISTELVHVICNKVENNQVLSTETIKQELRNPKMNNA